MAEIQNQESCLRACVACHAACIAAADARVAHNAGASLLEIPDEVTDGLLAVAKLCSMTVQALENLDAMHPSMMNVLLEKCRAACVAIAGRFGAQCSAGERHAAVACLSCADSCVNTSAALEESLLALSIEPS